MKKTDVAEAPPKAKPLTAAAAARLFKETKPQLDELERKNKAARARLLEHFHETEDTEFMGIGYSLSWVTRLDTGKAREALGPDAAAACEVQSKRETLSLSKRPGS